MSIPRITQEIKEIMHQISRLTKPQHDLAAARLAVAQPIVQTYFGLYEEDLNRYLALHQSTCTLAVYLSKSFNQIAAEGFCTPQDPSAEDDKTSQKLEKGTGLGEGEGVDNISHEITDPEELTDIAQEPNSEKEREDMANEKDAVDMADDMEGRTDAVSADDGDENDSDGEGTEDGLSEKAEDVDDLDPGSVNEKFWDGERDETNKDQASSKPQGEAIGDEQIAAPDAGSPQDKDADGGGDDESVGVDEREETQVNDQMEQDPHVPEGDVLDLPNQMDIDYENESHPSDDLGSGDDSSMVDREENGYASDEAVDESDTMDAAETESALKNGKPEEEVDEGKDDHPMKSDVESDAEIEENSSKHDEGGPVPSRSQDAMAEADDLEPSAVQGAGDDQKEDAEAAQEQRSEGNAKRDEGSGTEGKTTEAEQESNTENPEFGASLGRQRDGQRKHDEQSTESAQTEAFRKLGDVLDKWHRQHRPIQEASQNPNPPQTESPLDPTAVDFEHLQADGDAPDAQALGSATEDQARPLDDSMAIESSGQEPPRSHLDDESSEPPVMESEAMDIDEGTPGAEEHVQMEELQTSGMAKTEPRSFMHNPSSSKDRDTQDEEDDVEEVDASLSEVHLSSSTPQATRPASASHALWVQYEARTRSLSLNFTEQLRLILSPTVASKMRGDFRTGKRLNIKRIIPYIASQYKRDKIWMRRTAPTKRNYQIMLAVDDSRSMAENRAGELAFETLVMVARSMAMLEVGQVCVVAFGEDVKVAHSFETSLSGLAAGDIFQHFSFRQRRTDVRALLARSLDLFRDARASGAQASSSADPWQLQLIISDGICDQHAAIRQLVRQAREERIMVVFIIVDNGDRGTDAKGMSGSILDMTAAKFEREFTGSGDEGGAVKLKLERYLDSFPFPYYLVLRDAKELPAVLASALRQWFRDVVEAGG
ncbi:MAG: hypothetical protein M1826_005090 [Phylliscum demangeonii]|nr:MAG: hypothetical protein M1826_005090 [Phylliscum demangeonii]